MRLDPQIPLGYPPLVNAFQHTSHPHGWSNGGTPSRFPPCLHHMPRQRTRDEALFFRELADLLHDVEAIGGGTRFCGVKPVAALLQLAVHPGGGFVHAARGKLLQGRQHAVDDVEEDAVQEFGGDGGASGLREESRRD